MKTWVENPKEPLGKDPEKDKTEYGRWEKNTEEKSSVGRPTGQPRARAVLSIFCGRPARSTDRKFTLCLGFTVDRPVDRYPQRSEIPTIGSRPEEEFSAVIFPDGYILLSFSGSFPNRSFRSSTHVFIPYK